jgi:anti-anti-sigma factor
MDLLKIVFIRGEPPMLQLDGEIDLSTADQLRTALEDALAKDPHVVIDMAGVTFVDAAGLRALLKVAESRDGAGALPLLNAHRVARILEIVGLREMPSIDIRDDGDARGR